MESLRAARLDVVSRKLAQSIRQESAVSCP
jgi:hypothetical protein